MTGGSSAGLPLPNHPHTALALTGGGGKLAVLPSLRYMLTELNKQSKGAKLYNSDTSIPAESGLELASFRKHSTGFDAQ